MEIQFSSSNSATFFFISHSVKRSKTPAQDRLQGVVKKKAVFIENVREMVDKQTKHSDNNKRLRMHSVNSIGAKKQSTTAKNDVLDSVKPIQTVDDSILTRNVLEINKQSIPQAQNVSPDKIRVLFSSKTPAQDRLKSFQPNASVNGNGKSLSFNALNVFHSSFGVSDSTNTTVSDSMDEEMEWEDCVEDSNYTFQQLEDMVVEFFNDPSQSAYIIPDTNVFLDSLAPIKCVMDKGKHYLTLMDGLQSSDLKYLWFVLHRSKVQHSGSVCGFARIGQLEKSKRGWVIEYESISRHSIHL